ncbi:MAG: hypothetical protein HC902_01525, partial [Calothrix sp. SM1_5_4]|nr:hypothetical protein [Calothrix sp. SM1_5_4]
MLLIFCLVGTPLGAAAQSPMSMRLFLETDLQDIDSTRFTIDFGELSTDELGRLPQIVSEKTGKEILPDRGAPLKVYVFVPSRLPTVERDEFIASVRAQMTEFNPLADISVEAVDIDIEEASRGRDSANARVQAADDELTGQGTNPASTRSLAASLRNLNDARRRL